MSDALVTSVGAVPGQRRVRRWPTFGVAVSFAILGFVGVCAIIGPLLFGDKGDEQDLLATFQSPSSAHLLGTDDLGRDVLARVFVGARSAVIGPVLVALGSMLVGNALGLTAGYAGGRVEAVIMRLIDFVYSLPALLVGIVVAGVLGGGYLLAVGILVFVLCPYDARIVHAAVLDQKHRAYVEAARTLGLPGWRIVVRHLLPNVLPLSIVTAFVNFAYALTLLSSLSFLGLGVPPGQADWGRMLAEARDYLFENPVAALVPAVMIVSTAASMNIVGDHFYERMTARGRAR